VIDELGHQLGAVGIRGRLRRRIVAEFRDHRSCAPDADLSDPRAIARQFADELGTSRSRRAAFAAFGALGIAGVAYTVAFVAANTLGRADLHPRSPLLAGLASVTAVVAPQVEFVAGSLALLRALRGRRARALPAAELRVLARRTPLALACGLATMGAVALLGYEYGVRTGIAFVAAAAGGGALLLDSASVLSAVRVHATAPGDSSDVFADLAGLVPKRLRGNPWRVSRAVALLVELGVWVAGMPRPTRSTGFCAAPSRRLRASAASRCWGASSACAGRGASKRPARELGDAASSQAAAHRARGGGGASERSGRGGAAQPRTRPLRLRRAAAGRAARVSAAGSPAERSHRSRCVRTRFAVRPGPSRRQARIPSVACPLLPPRPISPT
jgi:hypothetical protein